MSENNGRRWRAVLRNALTWGAAWALAGGVLVGVLALFSPEPEIESLAGRLGVAVLAGGMWGVRFGIAGAAMGTLFSTVVRFGYRGKRLADISPGRFALLGAVVGGVGVPLFLQTMNVLSGDGPISWGLVLDDAPWAAAFGAAAAAGSILLARRADVSSSEATIAELSEPNDLDALPAAEPRESLIAERERSARY